MIFSHFTIRAEGRQRAAAMESYISGLLHGTHKRAPIFDASCQGPLPLTGAGATPA